MPASRDHNQQRRNGRRLMAALLAASAMLLPMGGCGFSRWQPENTEVASPATAGLDVPAAMETPVMANGPLGRYDPAIEIHFVRDVDEDMRDNILPNCPGETFASNRWIRAFHDDLGIDVVYDWTTPTGDAYTQKLNVTLASGDLPDVIGVDAAQLKQLSDADLIEDLTDAWNTHASEALKGYYTLQGPGILGASTFDGRLKGIVQAADAFGDGTFLWIRADWLRSLGLSPPKTMDDVLAISDAFTRRDPDGNGKDDTFGLAVVKDLYNPCMGLEGFFAGYHAYPYMWIEDASGGLVYGSTLPEVRRTLQVLAGMYAAGQLEPEFGVLEIGNVAEAIEQGRIGMEFGAQWNPMYPLISSHRADPKADWTGYPLVSADDGQVLSPCRFTASRFYAVRKGYPHPEALVKMMNLHAEKNWGADADFNRYYMPQENGSVGVWKFSPVYPAPPLKNLDAYREIVRARAAGTTDRLTGEAQTIERNVKAYLGGDSSQWGWERIYGAEGVYRWVDRYVQNNWLFREKFTGAPTGTMVERRATLEKMEREAFIKIIMGVEPIEAFDRFVDDWNRLGGGQITREVNAWYNETR